ncbi:SEC-C domain-containing protein [Streptomyces sp. LP11]|uniref:SEC-C domain-containing protein n=1 Tax=Streptomyces pyxinicus TaxID=2970331 RepID=A0ABT2BB25_9ACTN|nr:SEC-C domain-containing protein [Streptomyces sp. LP11]MCS0605689.1 SEC-C domain-containing protein [Streptomyces sp. LP11]
MSFEEEVVQALGRDRADRVQAAARQLMTLADDDAQSTQAVVHINVPLHAHNAHDATAELTDLLNAAAPEETWTFVTVSHPDGTWSGKASPFMQDTTALGSREWIAHFALTDLHMRMAAWRLTQLWRAAELAEQTVEALGRWRLLVAAACSRSLLEGAAALTHETTLLHEAWDTFKKAGPPTTDSLTRFSADLNNRLAKLQYASRVGQSAGRPPVLQSTNVMTYINKLAKNTTTVDVLDLYEWLCDAVHPSFGSATTHTVLRASDRPKTHAIEHYARRPLKPLAASGYVMQPTVAHAAADALVLAAEVVDSSLSLVKWTMDDIGLTAEIHGLNRLSYAGGSDRSPQRSDTCPCGSGRKYKRCVHRWGQPSTPPSPTAEQQEARPQS